MQLFDQFFLSFGLLSLVALFGGYLSARWKQPTVVGLLVAGMLLGPHGLGLINDSDFIQLFAEFGAVMLLFSIGVEFSLSKILGSGVRALAAATAIMLGLFIIGYEVGVLLGLGYLPTLALAACLTFSSTAIFMRLIQQFGLAGQPQVPLLVSVLVIEDLVAVAAMAFFASLGSETARADHIPAMDIALSLFYSLAVMGTVYLVVRAAFKRLRRSAHPAMRTQDNLVLLALALCVLLAALASFIGLSPAIGAFMAGSILAGFPIRDEVEKVLSPFSLAFSSFFFISIGLMVNPAAALAFWPLVLGISALFLLSAIVIVTTVVFLSGFSFSQALVAGLSMGVLGEFSLFLAKQVNPLVPGLDLVTLLSSSVVLTTLAASLLLARYPRVASALRASCAPGSRSLACQVRDYSSSVLAEFEGSGVFLARSRAVFSALRRNLALFAVIGLGMFLSRRLFSSSVVRVADYPLHLPTVALLVSFILLLPALLDILRELRLMADALAAVFIRQPQHDERSGRRMARDFMLLLAMVALALLHPLAVDALTLPDFFHWGVVLPLAGMVLAVWDMLALLHRAFHRHLEGSKPF